MSQKLICKAKGRLNNGRRDPFDYAVLFLSIPVSEESTELFDVLAFAENEVVRYFAKPDELIGDTISFRQLPSSFQSACRGYWKREHNR